MDNSQIWDGAGISDIKKQKVFGTEFVVFYSSSDEVNKHGIFMFDKSVIVEGTPEEVAHSIRNNIGKLTFENAPAPSIHIFVNPHTEHYEYAVEGNDNILSIAWIEEVAAGVEYDVILSGLKRNLLQNGTYKFIRCTSSKKVSANDYPGLQHVQDIQIIIKDDEPHVFYNIVTKGKVIMEARRH